MATTADSYRDPERFWRKIKNLMGNINPSPHYLLDQHNSKIETPEGKEKLHRRVWQEVYTGEFEPEDNEAEEHNTYIIEFIQEYIHRTTPHDSIDTTRLDSNTPLTVPLTTQESIQIIKQMKKSSPGSSGINKTILKHLPENAIGRLTKIFNSALSAGYFPDIWKIATI